MLTLDGNIVERTDVGLAYHVPDCPEIRALILNVQVSEVGDLNLADFNEALHPRAPRGKAGGGRFISKLLHELKPGEKFEHPQLGTMERLAQGGAKRADGRLTVRSIVTGKRVHMNPTRSVQIEAPKALRVKKASPGRKGPSALSRELTAKVGTPAQYQAKIADMAKSRPIVTVVDKAGRAERGILQPSEFRKGEHELVTGTHILERRYHDRNDFQTHTIGLPGDLAEEKRKLDASKTIGGSKPERVGRSAYAETRIRKLGSPPEHPTAEEAAQIERANKGEFTYVPWRTEATRARPFNPNDAHAVTAEDGRQAFNPATLNKGAISDVAPSAKNIGMQSPGSRKAINATSRPPEGYFPGAQEHTLVRRSRAATRFGGTLTPVKTGSYAEMQKALADLPKEERGYHQIEGPKTTPVTFVSPIDGSIVTRNLTPAEHEKFMRLVEKSPEAKVRDALPQLKSYSSEHAMENIRPAKLSSLEPGTPFFDRHATLKGVRGVEKKGGIEVHEKQSMGQYYRDKVKARLAQGDETVHVRAGRQTSLMPGPQVGHVHIATAPGGFQRLVDRTGQEHATGLTQEEAQRRLRAMNDAYDAEHGIGHIKRTATGHITVPAVAAGPEPQLQRVKLGDLNVGDRIHYASAEQAQRDYANKRGGQIHPPGVRGAVGEPYGEVVGKSPGSVHLHFPAVHRPGQSEEYSPGADVYVPGGVAAGASDLPPGRGPHAPQEPAQSNADFTRLNMPGGEPTTAGFRRGDAVYHPEHGEGIVRRAGAEPYTREHGLHIEWADGHSSEWPVGSEKIGRLRYTGPGGGATGSPIAEAGTRRGVQMAVHSASQTEAEREAKYLREYSRRFGSAGSAAITRSLRGSSTRVPARR